MSYIKELSMEIFDKKLKESAQNIAYDTQNRINVEAQKLPDFKEMPYKSQYILEEVIKILKESV